MALDNTGSMAARRQDRRVADRRDQPDQPAERARQESRRRLHFDRFPSPRSSTSAPAITARPGSTGPTGRTRRRSSRTSAATQAEPCRATGHSIGPGSTCPFTNSNSGFVCTISPVNRQLERSRPIPSSGAYAAAISARARTANSHTLYNGCWTSTNPTTQAVLLHGLVLQHAAAPTTPATCSGSFSSKVLQAIHLHAQLGRQAPKHVDGLHHRPHAALRRPERRRRRLPISRRCSRPTSITRTARLIVDPSSSTPLQPIVPLSYNWSALKATIAAMQPTGGTNQAVGLAWAWQTLLQNAPMNAPAEDPNYTYNRAIILLSDGLNTEDRWPVNGDGSTQNINGCDRRPSGAAVREHQGHGGSEDQRADVHDLHDPGRIPAHPPTRPRPCCKTARAIPSKFFMLTIGKPDRHDVQLDRHRAVSELRVAR